ncbi:hypothetical protein [Lysinibacillus sp. UBA5990]|uniref:hypothetical protein n=1 Tax=Lysinibacillus sp. UBA5990 TaxID=1946773 RepID=UPI0025BD9293|nr:hypothetical protein [Lysinibacillus sp. UBA5990]
MDNDIVKNNDPLQLQQMIIFLRAELAKYKNEVKRLRDSDYYALVLRLERENIQLTRLRKDLSMELLKLKRDFDKELEAYDQEIQKRELQRKKQIASIESLLKELNELRAENKLLKENIDVSIEETNYKSMIDRLDKRLNDFTIVTGEKMEHIVETIEQSYRNKVEADSLYEQIVKELETKNLEIEKLTNEIKGYKNQSYNSKVKMNESINIDEQIDYRLRMLDELDQKLNELAFEINRE